MHLKYQRFLPCSLIVWLAVYSATISAEVIDLTQHTNLRGAFLLPLPHASEVDVHLLIHAGEIDNNGPQGLPHYLEHLVLWSADKAHGNANKDRSFNAWTSNEWTVYWNNGPPAKTRDMLTHAALVFAPLSLDHDYARQEVSVVEREFDFSIAEAPNRQLRENMLAKLYRDHPFGRSILGNRQSIRQLKPQAAQLFKDRWYLANNAYLLISGPLTEQDVVRRLKTDFSQLPVGDVPPHPWTQTRKPANRVHVAMHSKHLTRPLQVFMTTADTAVDLDPLQRFAITKVLTAHLNSTSPGSLVKPLYYDEFIASTVNVASYAEPDLSATIYVEARPEDGVTEAQLFAAIEKFFDDTVHSGIAEKPFKTVQKKFLQQLDRLSSDSAFATHLGMVGIIMSGRPLTTTRYIRALESLSHEHVNRFLKYFSSAALTATGTMTPR